MFKCDNCDYTTTDDDDLGPLSGVDQLWERLDAGSVVPHGVCPECDCFCYEDAPDPEAALRAIRNDCREVAEGREDATPDFWHAILCRIDRALA